MRKIVPLSLAVAVAIALATAPATNASSDYAYQQALSKVQSKPNTAIYQAGIVALRELSDAGDAAASAKMGEILLGQPGPDSFEYASTYYELAIKQGSPEAQGTLAAAYMQRGLDLGVNSVMGRQALAKAAEHYRPLVDSDDKSAMWNVGYMLVTGNGLERDVDEGVTLINKAAEAGNPSASYWMANYLKQTGSGNEGQIDRFLGMAAARGHMMARKTLEEQRGIPLSSWAPSESTPKYQAQVRPTPLVDKISTSTLVAASGKLPPPTPTAVASQASAQPAILYPQPSETENLLAAAQNRIIQLNLQLEELRTQLTTKNGITAASVNQEGINAVLVNDYETALTKFRLAADRDFAPGISNLALMYTNGPGATRDARQAAALFKRAADMGNVTAAENLGRLYEYGIAVHRDRSKAIFWYERAIALGSTQAVASLENLRTRR